MSYATAHLGFNNTRKSAVSYASKGSSAIRSVRVPSLLDTGLEHTNDRTMKMSATRSAVESSKKLARLNYTIRPDLLISNRLVHVPYRTAWRVNRVIKFKLERQTLMGAADILACRTNRRRLPD